MSKNQNVPMRDKHRFTGTLITSFFLAAVLSPFISSMAYGEETVNGLRQAGWTVTGKTEHDEWRAGREPYKNLGRLLYVATYTLQKDERSMTCTLARDNMFDTFTQTCEPILPSETDN